MPNYAPDVVIEHLVNLSQNGKRVLSDARVFAVNELGDDLDLLLAEGHRLHLAEEASDLIQRLRSALQIFVLGAELDQHQQRLLRIVHLEALLDQVLHLSLQDGVVVSYFVTQERDHDFGLVLPEQILALYQEHEKLGVEIVHAALEGRITALIELDVRPLEDDIHALFEIVWLSLDQTEHLLDDFDVLFEVSAPHQR